MNRGNSQEIISLAIKLPLAIRTQPQQSKNVASQYVLILCASTRNELKGR